MRARAWTIVLLLIVAVVVLLTLSRVLPGKPVVAEAKVVEPAEPGISHLEDIEVGPGILYVVRNNQTRELFGLYVIPGQTPVIASLGVVLGR